LCHTLLDDSRNVKNAPMSCRTSAPGLETAAAYGNAPDAAIRRAIVPMVMK
jgi:hypothetical protein